MFVSFRQGSEFDCTMRYQQQQQQQQHAADATTAGLTADQLPHTNPTLVHAASVSSTNSTSGAAVAQSSNVTSPRGNTHGNNTATAGTATGSHSVGPGVTSTIAASTTSAVGFLHHFHSNGFAPPAAAAAATEGELVRYGDR
jgi:hypothetical protein